MAFLRRGKKIGVIEFQGIVGRAIRADTHLPLLERARTSSRFGAVVLVIDSPGGSAAAAEELHLAVQETRGQEAGGGLCPGPGGLGRSLYQHCRSQDSVAAPRLKQEGWPRHAFLIESSGLLQSSGSANH